MKKILLSVLFMSIVSMTAVAGQQQQMNECEFGVIIEPFSPINPNVRRATAFIDMTQYETCGDFVAAMRNTLDPESGLPYIEGTVNSVQIISAHPVQIIINGIYHGRNNRRDIPLNARLADFNIVPTDRFNITSLAEQEAPAIQQEAPEEAPVQEVVVDLLDEYDSDNEYGGNG